jgi:hypothetical protein
MDPENDPENVRLAAPGAGLPFLEHLISRYYWFPKFCKNTTWDQAHALFQKQGARLLQLARALPESQRTIRVLIPRVPGIEDSSRHWSVAMVLEHLMIVGKLMGEGIVELTHGPHPGLGHLDGGREAFRRPRWVGGDRRLREIPEAFRAAGDDGGGRPRLAVPFEASLVRNAERPPVAVPGGGTSEGAPGSGGEDQENLPQPPP